ncbi:hypothetical protein [Streptomyces sp. NPDC005732]|uniref:hypothetical protein n=1 Tax=Streptomyces sp. NPDC005732 TaxID=3157057 RepID=UPI0034044A8F
MSVAAHAAAPAAEHPEPHTAAAGALPRAGGLTVRVPLRLVAGSQYSDAALAVYVKIAALALRPEGCTARVATLAQYLGMSKSAAERGLGQLVRPDIIDGLVEVPTVRRTLPGGRGQSAHRITRDLADGELWVRIPVRAAEALSPRLLRLYALLAYATARRMPATAAELGEQLFHHTGQRAGQHLGERQARRLVDELEATGWLTVHRREGEHGRHAYETRRSPLRSVPAPAAAPAGDEQLSLWGEESPVIHDGSGPDLDDGSLASKEDLQTDRLIKTQVVGVIRRRRSDRKWVATPVDNRLPAAFGRGNGVLRTDDEASSSSPAPGRAPYTGPALQISPRVWRVLEPVHHELPALRRFVLREIARAIGAQLDTGTTEERLTDRITRRYARTTTIRDTGRWLLGAALVRRGCGIDSCESGTVWETGAPCETCMTNAAVRRAREQREADLARSEQQLADARRRRLEYDQAAQEEQRAVRAAGRARQQLLAELGPDGILPRRPASPDPADLPPPTPWPARATAAERAAATDHDIRTAIVQLGRAAAVHRYGRTRVLPHLAVLDLPDTGS